MLSILILLASCFFSDEAQARVFSGESKTAVVVQNNNDVLSAFVNTHGFDLEQCLIRVVPATRCGQVHKYVGNGQWSVQPLSTIAFPHQLQFKCAHVTAKNSYLAHIYPSHNFW